MYLIPLLLLCYSVLAADNTLLTLTKSHSCLKVVVFQFVKAQNCTLLLDHQKSQLALQMTKCLLSNMGKPFPKSCEGSISECKLQGDAWSTFTTFYAHIDNLCHFYWEMLHHQRAEALITKLSDSSTQAQRVMRQNTLQTKKILQIQNQMQANLQISLTQQQQMSRLIQSSATHVANITQQIEIFVSNIRQDLNHNYASISNVLKIINEGVQQIVQIQSYMKADITSIHGILYFIAQFLLILFLTSFKTYQPSRNSLLFTLFIQVSLQISIPSLVYSIIGIKLLRILFIIVMTVQLILNSEGEENWQRKMTNQLNTPRLERIMSKVVHNQKQIWNQRYTIQAVRGREMRQMREKEEKKMPVN